MDIASLIKNGRGNMPAFSSLPDAQVQELAHFVRSINADAFDMKPAGDVAAGSRIFFTTGHCGECHNKDNLFGASDWSGRLEGGKIEGWYAPNITADGHQGVGSWSEADIVTFLKSGAAPGKGVALGPMKETIDDSLRYVRDDDLHAMAAYLKSVTPEATYRLVEWLHRGLLALSLVTVAGAVAGSLGLNLFAW